MPSLHPAYDDLAARSLQRHRLGHLASITRWDEAACMPPGGARARAEALGEMAALLHRLQTDAAIGPLLDAAAGEPLDADQAANLRELRRDYLRATALPESLVQRLSLAGSTCEHAWRRQRPANDWSGFLEGFRPMVALVREQAARLADVLGRSRYDALLDEYEPGMTSAEIDRVFAPLREWLPGLIDRALARQHAAPPVRLPTGPYPQATQHALCLQAMRRLGFDFERGRLDVSTHPFCGGVPEDVRMTTRYREDDFLQSLMGTIHETGHARYEQNLPREWLGQPLARARSMAIHESQSLSFEMQLARSPGFARVLSPLLVEHFGDQPAFAPDNLARLLTRVAPGRIRVDADEACYPAHVLLRYEIEKALVEGEIEADDVPALWNERMQRWLGLDTRGDFRDGPLQDVHWPSGAFGYFPCYTLGAMYAAQWFAAMRRARPTLDDEIAAGELSGVFDWLRAQIWSQGSRLSTEALTVAASGESLNPEHYRRHLERRYCGAA